MNVKKICCVIIVCAIMATLFTSCSVAKSKTATSSVSPNLAVIIASLKKDSSVREYAVSHNSQKIIVIKNSDVDNFGNDLYTIDVADKKQTKITGYDEVGGVNTLAWSYDDKYFSFVISTYVVFTIDVFKSSTLAKCLKISNSMGSAWSYSNDAIAASIANYNMKSTVRDSDGAPTNVIVYDMNTLKHRTVIKADPKCIYVNLRWDKSGLCAERYYEAGSVKLNISK